MSLRRLLRSLLVALLPISIASTVYLYLYPIFHACAFASRNAAAVGSSAGQHAGSSAYDTASAPFRLLILADPQLEGDSSLPNPDNAFVPSLHRHWDKILGADSIAERASTAQAVLKEIVLGDIPKAFRASRKRVDLFGNDYYLAHIYRTLHWWTNPTHVSVLGDLIGSQWVTDEEFEWRGWRYWNRVFKYGMMVEDAITSPESRVAREEELGADPQWSHRVINIVGNHDGGYGGDMTPERISRFERIFGKVNWDIKFKHHQANSSTTPTLHVIVLNSLNLDTPVISLDLQTSTYEFINKQVISNSAPVEDRSTFTLLLTHLPLHKPAGVCADAPFFDFYSGSQGDGIKEQNHLSLHTSTQGILEGIFGMSANVEAPAGGKGRNGVILTGHDHEGCDVWHFIPSSFPLEGDEGYHPEQHEKPWRSRLYMDRAVGESMTTETGIREITLRSMMGSYGGNAGLFSAWYDGTVGEWQYDMQMCRFGVQHWWWGVHVLDIVTVVVAALFAWMEMQLLRGRRKEVPGMSGTAIQRTKEATHEVGKTKDKTEDKALEGNRQGSARKKRKES